MIKKEDFRECLFYVRAEYKPLQDFICWDEAIYYENFYTYAANHNFYFTIDDIYNETRKYTLAQRGMGGKS